MPCRWEVAEWIALISERRKIWLVVVVVVVVVGVVVVVFIFPMHTHINHHLLSPALLSRQFPLASVTYLSPSFAFAVPVRFRHQGPGSDRQFASMDFIGSDSLFIYYGDLTRRDQGLTLSSLKSIYKHWSCTGRIFAPADNRSGHELHAWSVLMMNADKLDSVVTTQSHGQVDCT
ncbi:hypothetical protein ElyMa_006646900 [Elysia marginata]|uniref:Calcineurin-like phosphoesterase domain-containing protein n=1 Tax=Elysia marginata TaxID=1093978 RepID=A0AAV4IJM3_9GAST|nr:hypothetical protein ElyMa_006646900 [Elysia marginata]